VISAPAALGRAKAKTLRSPVRLHQWYFGNNFPRNGPRRSRPRAIKIRDAIPTAAKSRCSIVKLKANARLKWAKKSGSDYTS
jgi:hypothetical protein